MTRPILKRSFLRRPPRQARPRKRLVKAMAGLGGALAANEQVRARLPFDVEICEYEVPVANLPAAFDGFRLVQLTDLHLGYDVRREHLKRVVAMTNALKPDAVALTGDYADDGGPQVDAAWAEMANLEARYGVHAVLGNHDHWIDPGRSLEHLADSGFSVRHTARVIEKDGARLWIGGAGALWQDTLGIDAAFCDVPAEDCRICLAHYPDSADEWFDSRVDLMVSGHTHGGQVNIPGVPKFWTRPSVRNMSYMAGLIETPRTRLFVSRGIGCYMVPVRINCPPEIAVLRLRPETATGALPAAA